MFEKTFQFCGITVVMNAFSDHPIKTLDAAWYEANSPRLFDFTLNVNLVEKIEENTAGESIATSSGVTVIYQTKSKRLIIPFPDPPNHKADFFPHFLFFPALQHVLAQNGIYALHASAVELNGEAILFMGESGSGKSTSAAAMIEREATLLADDRVLLFEQNNQVLAAPSPAKPNPFAKGTKILTRRGHRLTNDLAPPRPLPIKEINHTTLCPEAQSTLAPLSPAESMVQLLRFHAENFQRAPQSLNFFTLLAEQIPLQTLTLGRGADSLYDRIA